MADENAMDRSGGVDISGGDAQIGGDVVGRDKIVQSGQQIHTGGGAYIGGNVTVDRGSKFVGRDDRSTIGLSGDEIARLFDAIYQKIDRRPDTVLQDKADLKQDVQEIQAEVAKGEGADESFLERRLRNVKRTAPDILEVVVNSFANPGLGLATAIRKVMEKAKRDTAVA